MIAAAPLSEIMDLIVTRDDVAHVKPDPEGFYKVLDALKAEPEEWWRMHFPAFAAQSRPESIQ